MSHGSDLLAKLAEHNTAMEETIRALHESCDGMRDRATKAEARVKELESDLLHERNRFTCLAIEARNAPVAGVADRIVTSPEFRNFVRGGSRLELTDLLDREVNR